MRESRDPNAAGLDYPGTITFSATLVLFTTAIIQAPDSGWGSPLIVGLLAASAVMLVAFVVVETRTHRPMLDLSYADVFVGLLHVLIVITRLSAFATFVFLSRTRHQENESVEEEKVVKVTTSA